MTLRLITPPDCTVVGLTDAKAFLRVTISADNTVIKRMLAAVDDWLAGETGWLGRSLNPVTWELRLPCFWYEMTLPRPPLIEVLSVAYTDSEGAEQVVTSDVYETIVAATGLPKLRPRRGQSWPSGDNVVIVYRAGYASGSPAAADVPPALKQAILTTVARLYDEREAGTSRALGDASVINLFAPYRIFT